MSENIAFYEEPLDYEASELDYEDARKEMKKYLPCLKKKSRYVRVLFYR